MRPPAVTTSRAAAAPADDEDGDARSERIRQLVRGVVRQHFGASPTRLQELAGGLTNAVWSFRVARGDYVIRTHDDAGKYADYLKERWAMRAARAAGVPTPQVLEVGNVAAGNPYMITEQVRGVGGDIAPNRLALLEALGRTAATLHKVRTHGFGPVFDWSENLLSRHASWRAWLVDGFGLEGRLRTLARNGLLDERQVAALRVTGDRMRDWRKPAVLHHGDLRLKNTIVDPDRGTLVALIDWESAMSSPAPYWDLALALHDLGIDEKEAFLSGYGLNARAIAAALPFVRLFNVLNYAKPVEAAVSSSDRRCVARFRVRLRGGLELYGS